jgi:hypothetical protein
MFALAQSALDLVWEAAADVEEYGRFRNADDRSSSILSYRNHVSGMIYSLLRGPAEDSRGASNLDHIGVRRVVFQQCELIWQASVDAHTSPEFRRADGNLDDDMVNAYKRAVREPGVTAIVNAVNATLVTADESRGRR